MSYDEDSNETESVVMDADGEVRMLNVERKRLHSLECLASEMVLMECKNKAKPLAIIMNMEEKRNIQK